MTQYFKGLSIKKIASLTVILIAFTAWFPTFAQMVLNFMTFQEPSALFILFIASIALIFVVIFLLTLLAMKFKERVIAICKIIIPFLMVAVIIFNWLYFMGYYRIFGLGSPTISGFANNGQFVGFLGDYTPFTEWMLLLSSAVMFIGLIPALYIYSTDGNGFLKFDKNFDLAIIIMCFYIVLRFGSIVGEPFRFSLICIIALFSWFVPSEKSDETTKEKPQEKEEDVILEKELQSNNEIFSLNQIPKYAFPGVIILLTFWLGAASLLDSGMPFNSWIWIFLAIGVILRMIVIRKIHFQLGKITGLILFIIPGLLIFALISANIYVITLIIEPEMLAIGLFILGFFVTINSTIFSDKGDNRFLTHPVRFFFMGLLGILGYASPLLVGTNQPYTDWVITAYFGIFFIISIIVLIRKVRSTNIKGELK